MVQLELHQLSLRYEGLRRRHPAQERALLGSLAELGQQSPIVVISEAAGAVDQFVLIDGYKRVRALRRLARDTVQDLCWQRMRAICPVMPARCHCSDTAVPVTSPKRSRS